MTATRRSGGSGGKEEIVNINAEKELEKRGHKFVRYADDSMILCRTRKSAQRTLEHIVLYIEGKLFLRVNLEKTTVANISKVKYLGYGFYRVKGKCRMRIHPKSVTRCRTGSESLRSEETDGATRSGKRNYGSTSEDG